MKDRETRRYDMCKRVKAFGRDYLADLPPDSEGARYLAAVDAALVKMDAAKSQQKHPRATAAEVLLDALLLDLKAISKTARAIDQDTPGFAEPFMISSYNPSALMTTADSVLVTLAKEGVAQRFIALAMPVDFVKNLRDDVQAIQNAHLDLDSGNNAATAKTKAVGLSVSEGIKAVNYLDAVVTNKYGRNAEVMRAWQTASHIERAPQREKPATPTTNGSTPAA